MGTLKDRLDSYPNQPEQEWKERSIVAVGEKGQTYRVTFASKQMSAVYAIDGGIINDKKCSKCDKLILVCLEQDKWFELFIELKGRDISHAIEQIEATVRNTLFADKDVSCRQARVIGRNIPRSTGNSVTEIAKKRFIARYNCRLEFKTGPYNETLRL